MGVSCAEVRLEDASAGAVLDAAPVGGEVLVGGRLGGRLGGWLGAGVPCAEVGLEPRRRGAGWVGGRGRPMKGFTPGGPGAGSGNGFGMMRVGSRKKGWMGPADGSGSVGDWLGALVRFMVGGPVVG